MEADKHKMQRAGNLESLIKGLDVASRLRFKELLVMAGKKGAAPEPAEKQPAVRERSDRRQFESIGMIIRKMVDNAGMKIKGVREEDKNSEEH